MVCSEHSTLRNDINELKVDMAEVRADVKSLNKSQEVFLKELRDFMAKQDCELKSKVSWRTFSLIVVLVGAVIGAVYINIKELDAKVNEFKVSLQHCVFR